MNSETIEPSPQIADNTAGSSATAMAQSPKPAGDGRRNSIRLRLAALVLACVLPVWIAAGLLVYYNYQSRRVLTEQRMLETARALAMVVDRELSEMQASLNVLAKSQQLVSGDLPGFYRLAQAVRQMYPDANIIVTKASGKELVNLNRPLGAVLPKRGAPDAVRQVYATGRPVFTSVYRGSVSGQRFFSIDVPVFREGTVVYDLAMALPVDHIAAILYEQRLPPEWIGTIIGADYLAVARSRSAEQFIAKTATPAFVQHTLKSAEGTVELPNFEGRVMIASFSRSAVSGWTVVIGVPRAVVKKEIWRWIGLALAATALLSLVGMALALRMAHRIAGSIQGLIAPVLALGNDEPVNIGRLDLLETSKVGESLLRASQLIQQRAQERERAEAAQRESAELKRLNAELEQSEAKARARAEELAAFMDAVPAISFMTDNSGEFRETRNRAARELFSALGLDDTSQSAPADGPSGIRLMKDGKELSPEEWPIRVAVNTGHDVRQGEYEVIFEDGNSRNVFGNAVPIFDATHRVRGAVSAYIDITDLRRAEEQLQATAERLRAVLDRAPVGIVTANRDNHFEETNAAFQRMTGFSGEELRQMDWKALTHPDDVERNVGLVDGLMQGELQSYDFEKRYLLKDGKTIWVRVNGTRLDEGHKISIIEDITERKQAQAEMARLAAIVESSEDAIWSHTSDGVITSWNASAAQLFGYTAEEIVGQNTALLVPAERKHEMLQNLQHVRQGGRVQQMETVRQRQDGTLVDVSLSIAPTFQEGKITGSAVIARDISKRKKMERALRQSEDRFQLAVRATKDLIWDMDIESGSIWRSVGYWVHFGYEPQRPEPDVRAWLHFIHPEDRERVLNTVQTALARGDPSYEYEYRFRRADGSYAHALCRAAIIVDEAGRPSRAVGAVTDLTDRVQLEEQLRQAQKLEAVGRLAGGVAHDFNNLLMVISSYGEMLATRFGADGGLRKYTEQILKAAERGANLTQQMLAFSRKQLLTPRIMDLNAIVEETSAMIKRLIGEDIELKVRPGKPLSLIEADPGQITQVLLNLCVNSRDAMPEGGTITITTQDAGVDAATAALHRGFTPGQYVLLAVTDTGTGMTREIQDRIFEPFFTTKEQGKGTGLGLSTVYGIVKQSGGYIQVNSQPGHGTCFTLYFPQTQKKMKDAASEAGKNGGLGETILLVEDEDQLRMAISEYLQESGYKVLEAPNGEEALKLAEAHTGPIHALVTDVIMPRMSGPELVSRLSGLANRYNVMTVYMSGYADQGIVRQGILRPGTLFIQKPFSLAVLTQKIREVLRVNGRSAACGP